MSCVTVSKEVHASLVKEFETELLSIAEWWAQRTLDPVNGGFVGEVDLLGIANIRANKGGILNARILWFFSELACYEGSEIYRGIADIAYRYLTTYFWDEEYHGIYWELDCRGKVVDSKKHVYTQAFAIYALCAYHRLTGSDDALVKALTLFEQIEVSAYDSENGGYHEAFSRSWGEVREVALSAEEPNYPKTMNTHLHLFEAYSALHAVHPRENIRYSLKRLLECFVGNFIDPKTYHLRIYFDDAWRDMSSSHSYGHDIECSWLIWESVQAIGDERLSASLAPVVLGMAQACLDCLGQNGEILDGYDLKELKRIEARTWWAQAEALVGFLNAYSMTGDTRYFQAFENIWGFIKKYQRDEERGEWLWYSLLDSRKSPYKIGFWKAPYHNGRAMLEVCRRLRQIKGRSI